MADDLSLLLRIKGDASSAKNAAAETRAAVAQLRTSLGSEFNQIQNAGQKALAGIGDNLNTFVGARVPLIGGAFLRVTDNLKGVGAESKKVDADIAKLGKTIDGLSASTGKSRSQITSFLQSFVQLETQAKRDAAVIQTFGAATAQTLIPQLEKAGTEMATVAANTEAVGASLAGVAGPVGIAVVAIAALTVGAIALSKQFLDLVISTAAWEGKLYDLAQQTGVSVETLSTLSALAEDTGGSIEGVAQSLVIFQGKLEEAQDSSTKAGKIFAELGISTNDTEQAFREALKALAAMEEGFRQTNDATELFGKRGGKQVLAILKESHGDIDATTEKLRALNSLVTGPVAKGADGLNDQLNATRRQFQGLQAQIVNDSMPSIIKALEQLSKILRENRETFILLGQAIGYLIQGNLRLVAPAVEIASLAFRGHLRALAPVIEAYERFAAVLQIVSGNLPSVDPNAIPAVGAPPVVSFGGAATLGGGITRKKGSRGGGGRTAKDSGLDDATKAAELTERELFQKIEADIFENKRALANHVRDIEEYTRRGVDLSDQQLNATIDRINAEIAALDSALVKKLISRKEFERKNKELDIETKAAVQKNAEEISELEDRRDREVAEAELAAHKRSAQMADEASDRLIAIIQDRVERQEIAESEGEKQIAALLAQGYERRKKLLEDELDDFGTSLERKKEINDALIQLEGERADAAVRASQRIIDALKKEQEEREKLRKAIEDAAKETTGGAAEGLEKKDDRSEWDKLDEWLEGRFEGAQLVAAQAGIDALRTAFEGLGQAVGQVVEAWVLYGKAGQSIRQVTAQILAQVAAQAAVKAVFELAEGFAALALSFFGMPNAGAAAAAHFQAAAIYGGIAAVAAVAGRAIAGDSFKKSTDSGGGSSGGSRSGSSERGGAPSSLDVNRRTLAEPQTLTRTLEFRVKGDAVVQSFVEDYNFNGRTRVIIKSDGQG